MAKIYGARFKYLRHGIDMFTNGLNMWEMTYICGKGLKRQKND